MSANPFLTVMLPVYNGEKYIADALRSVLDQPCRDLEVLVLDDGSTDGTLGIVRGFQERDARVRVDSHPNYGIGRNRNEGFALVRGTCLIFLDDDDVLVPGFYTEETKRTLQDLFDHDIETVVPSRLHANEGLTGCYLCKVPLEGVFPGNGEASLSLPYEFTTIIYRADVIERNHIRFSNGFPEMESIFRHRCVFCSRKVLFTNDFHFIVRRDNPTQLTKVWDVDQVVRVRAQKYAELAEWHRERGTTGRVMEETEARARQAQAELDAYRPQRPSPLERLKEGARLRREHRQWLAGMEPLTNYYYEGSESARESQRAALANIRSAAGLG